MKRSTLGFNDIARIIGKISPLSNYPHARTKKLGQFVRAIEFFERALNIISAGPLFYLLNLRRNIME